MNRWDNLSMSEKNQLLGIYVSKGYTDLASIINHYNSFVTGGQMNTDGHLFYNGGTDGSKEDKNRFPSLFKLALGYLKNPNGSYMTDNYTEDQLQDFRKRAYANFLPYKDGLIESIIPFVHTMRTTNNTIPRNIYNEMEKSKASYNIPWLDESWALYNNIPEIERRKYNKTEPFYIQSKYTPSIGKATYNKVYELNPKAFSSDLNKAIVDLALNENMSGKKNILISGDDLFKNNFEDGIDTDLDWTVLKKFTVGQGMDKKGYYVSLYDDWDLNPLKTYLGNNQGDLTQGFGNPFTIYNRVYLDDYYGVNTHGGKWLPELEVWDFVDGPSRFDNKDDLYER